MNQCHRPSPYSLFNMLTSTVGHSKFLECQLRHHPFVIYCIAHCYIHTKDWSLALGSKTNKHYTIHTRSSALKGDSSPLKKRLFIYACLLGKTNIYMYPSIVYLDRNTHLENLKSLSAFQSQSWIGNVSSIPLVGFHFVIQCFVDHNVHLCNASLNKSLAFSKYSDGGLVSLSTSMYTHEM